MKKMLVTVVALLSCATGFAQGGSDRRLLTEMKRGELVHEISYDSEGRVSVVKCQYYNWVSTYDYSALADNIVTMKVEKTDRNGEPIEIIKEYTMRLGDNGLISRVDYIVYEYVDERPMSYDFSYNDDNNIIKIDADEGGQVYEFDYEGGNLISLQGVEDWAPGEVLEAHYTYGDIANVGKLVFYNFYFQSFDQLNFAFLTGLMGEPSKTLMTDAVLTADDETQTTDFKWLLDEDGYPYEMSWSETDSRIHTSFTWSNLTGINSVKEETVGSRYYSLEGIELDAPRRGINIVRNSDGTTRKVIK